MAESPTHSKVWGMGVLVTSFAILLWMNNLSPVEIFEAPFIDPYQTPLRFVQIATITSLVIYSVLFSLPHLIFTHSQRFRRVYLGGLLAWFLVTLSMGYYGAELVGYPTGFLAAHLLLLLARKLLKKHRIFYPAASALLTCGLLFSALGLWRNTSIYTFDFPAISKGELMRAREECAIAYELRPSNTDWEGFCLLGGKAVIISDEELRRNANGIQEQRFRVRNGSKTCEFHGASQGQSTYETIRDMRRCPYFSDLYRKRIRERANLN